MWSSLPGQEWLQGREFQAIAQGLGSPLRRLETQKHVGYGNLYTAKLPFR